MDFGNSPLGFGVWEDVQSIDASCGIQIDGFSARTEPPGSIFSDFHDLDVFVCVFWAFWCFERANDRLRVSKACPGCFSEFIHPGYSKSDLKGFHVAPLGSIFHFEIFCRSDPKPFRGGNRAGDR